MNPSNHVVSSEAPFNPPEGDLRQAHLKELADTMICQCGGCVRELLGTCTCGFAAKDRKDILSMMDAGKTDQQIVETYIQRYGLQVLASPPEEGFYHVGYWAPGIILTAGLVIGFAVVTRWRRKKTVPEPTVINSTTAADDAATKKLMRDLEDF